MRKAVFVAILALGAACLGGCNTIEGAGRDLSSAGKAVSETARDVKN